MPSFTVYTESKNRYGKNETRTYLSRTLAAAYFIESPKQRNSVAGNCKVTLHQFRNAGK